MGYQSINTLLLIVSLLIVNCATPAFAQTTLDPMSIGVGARALGMGKAYVAVAEDGDSMFTNPAGLGEIDSFQFTSMSGQVLEDVNYSVLGTVFPLGEKSAIGIGYATANVSQIELRDTAGTLQNYSNYGNGVFFASYGKKLTEKLSMGFNLKYFSQRGSNAETNGTGINLDIGLLQKDIGWVSLGAVGQNVLRSSMITYDNGNQENLPSIIKVGTRMYLLGQKFDAARLSPIELFAVADIDLSMQTLRSSTSHIGFELSPFPILALRAGMDQAAVPGGIQNNYTSGVSLKLAGFGFHYAYHPYTEYADNVSHYFSISFNERNWPEEELPDIFLSSQ